MLVSDFDFDLPTELIAQEPAEPRDAARLLVVGATLREAAIHDLADDLHPGDLLVVNDTRVLPTRFWGRRGEVPVEATLVEPVDGARWWALARPGKRLRPGDVLVLADGLTTVVEAKGDGGKVLLRFELVGEALTEAIRRHGAMPLPPYIRRPRGGDARDRGAYQTPFARVDGAVAAPTASLHFTPELIERLDRMGVGRAAVTLHVGAGTFAPVKVEDTGDHVMHAERFEVPPAAADAIAATRAAGRRVVAVGTTALRALESTGGAAGSGRTRLFITPGYRFTTVDLLLSNFHLPRSTLLMLVCAFAGTERIRAAYAHAVARRFRFFSYGDACLLERAA